MKSFVASTLAVAVLLGAASAPSFARDHGWERNRGWHGDIRYFDRHDARYWHSGGWQHGRHEGRLGWWWVVGGLWYFYPQPVYPYPDPYQPPVVVIEQSAPPPVQVQMPPVASPAPVQYWYYCDASKGYYPYVPACPSGWSKVPATPPGVAP